MDCQQDAYTDIGSRSVNEDSFFVFNEKAFLAVVADGLGGMGKGEVASALAAGMLRQLLAGEKPDEDALCDALLEVNREIRRRQKQGNTMMTTAAVLWMDDEIALAATVGDSRIYQFRGERIVFQSVDHSVAQMAVFAGEIKPEEIRTYPQRNRITRALGAEDTLRVSVQELRVCTGDRLLLCTDGFWELITEPEMSSLNARCDTVVKWLGEMKITVMRRKTLKMDNNTAIAVSFEAAEDTFG